MQWLGAQQAIDVRNELLTVVTDRQRVLHQEDCVANSQFIQGGKGQWTKGELESLAKRGGYTITMDMTRKAITSLVGMLTANKPKMKCLGRTENPHLSKIRTLQLDKTWMDSKGLATVTDIMYNAYSSNIAYAYVYPKCGSVRFKQLDFQDVFVDVMSRDMMFEDASWIAVQKWIPLKDARIRWDISDLSRDMPSPVTEAYNPHHSALPMFDKSGSYVRVFEIFRKRLIRNKQGRQETRIVRQLLVGYWHVSEEVMAPNIKTYPIIPLYSGLSRNPYKYSELHFMKDPQRFINKMYNVTIMNAQATGSPKVFVSSLDIPTEDTDSFAENYSIPGSVSVLNPNANPPTVVRAEPLSNSYFSLYQDATNYMMRQWSSLGLDGAVVDSQTNQTGINEKREAVMDNAKIPARIFDQFLSTMSRSALEHWSTYVSKDDIVKTIQGKKVISEVERDIKNGLNVKDEQSIMEFIQSQKQAGSSAVEINNYIDEAKDRREMVDNIFDIIMGIEDLEYYLEVVQDSYAPTYRAGKFNTAMLLADKGIVDAQTLVELSNLDNKEEILRRMTTVKSLSAQVEELGKVIEKYDSELDKKDQQIEKLMLELVRTKESARLDKQFKERQLLLQNLKKQANLDRFQQSAQNQISLEKLLLTMKEENLKLKERGESLVSSPSMIEIA